MRTMTISLLLFSLLICIIAAAAAAAAAQRSEEEIRLLFEGWLTKHKKSLNSLEEKESHFQVFKDNLLYIEEHNASEHGFRLGLNRFADLTNDEYRATFFGYGSVGRRHHRRFGTGNNRYRVVAGESLPDSIDWREKGAVVGVKDQGRCQSSWAFSAVAAVEGINKIITGELISASEQELIDCDKSFNNNGCEGGFMVDAFEFIISNGGIDEEDDYPYKKSDGKCDTYKKKNARVISIDAYEDVPVNNESSLKSAVANQPVSVAIEGSGRAFQFYESGIFSGSCGNNLDHGVTAVGYGSENGNDYWIVKNSWGAAWGEAGYVRLARNVGLAAGKCGIAMEASYPIKTSPNPPNPRPSPPSPSVCDNYHTCPSRTTCCCLLEYNRSCFAWACCPHDYPICDTQFSTCLTSKKNPLGVKALAFLM